MFVFLILLNCILRAVVSKDVLYTQPINPNLFSRATQLTDNNSLIGIKVLLNANKYCLGKWFQLKNFTDFSTKYLDFHGIDENHIRGPASQALSLAISLKTKVYDEKIVEKNETYALNRTLHLLSSLAFRHRNNTLGGWGHDWQTALWASYAGMGSWILWQHFNQSDKQLIENMVIYEANRLIDYKVPYYQDRNLKVLTPGDTKAEENAWNANIVQLALAMMPSHPNWKLWMRKNIELMISSYSRHSDLNRTVIINGKKINEWINGSNVFENGTVVNHNIIHPDYIMDIHLNLNSVLTSVLGGQPVPNATFWNVDLLYNALINLKWKSPPYRSPGGTIYIEDSKGNATGHIYYPQGNDWGTSRRMNFALLDTKIDKLTDFGKRFNANEWTKVHIEAQLQLQHRFTDGRTYGDHKEDTYPLREEWVAVLSSLNHLSNWINHNTKIRVTSDKLD